MVRTLNLILTLTLAGALTSRAASDELEAAGSPDEAIELEELTVTAIKQGQASSLQAAAATTITADQVEQFNIVDARSASDKAPNFFIPDYGSRMTSTIYVRGLGARIDQPVVGLNVDNVPVMNKDNYDFDIPDIAAVELIRGAQSTLFGRNTMGGVINVYTTSPLNFQGTKATVGYGTANTLRAAVSHYAKTSDKFGWSAEAHYNTTDGFFTNLSNGEKCDWERQWGGRTKLQWRPSATVSVDNVASLSVVRQGGYPYQYIETGEISYNDTCFYRRTSVADGLTVGLSLGAARISSITSYQYIDDNMTLDQDFLPVDYFTLTQAKREHAVTQEIIARNAYTGGKYNWIFGFFGFYKTYDMDAPVTFLDYGIEQLIESNVNSSSSRYALSWDERQFTLNSNFTNKNHGLALYHQSSLKAGRWSFTAGLRVDYEHTSLDYHSSCQTGYSLLSVADGSTLMHGDVDLDDSDYLSKSFWEFLPKIAVTYNFGKWSSAYISAARGYKAGGFNTQMFSDVLQQRLMSELSSYVTAYDIDDVVTYKPEHSWTFEAGTHLEWLDRTLTLDATVFYIHCTDQQLTMFPDGTTTGRMMTNAGSTRSYGIEIELNARPLKNVEAGLSYGYTNARFIEFDNGQEDFADKVIPYAPQNTIFAHAKYTIPVKSDWLQRIVIGANVKGAGKIYWDEANENSQPFYALLGATVRLQRQNVALDLWGENLTGTGYSTFYFESISNAFLQRGKPRRIGVTLRLTI